MLLCLRIADVYYVACARLRNIPARPRYAPMNPVFTARHPTEAHLVRGLLEAGGIRAEVRGDQLYSAFGELPVLPTVWIVDPADGPEAGRLIGDFLRGSAARRYAHERWTCAGCGETLEGQFTDCWNCGAPRAQPA